MSYESIKIHSSFCLDPNVKALFDLASEKKLVHYFLNKDCFCPCHACRLVTHLSLATSCKNTLRHLIEKFRQN